MKLKKILGICGNVLLGLFFAATLLLLVFAITVRAKGGQVSIFGYGLYQIVSGSMEPEIKVGDVVVGKRTPFAELKVGDNIVFRLGGKLVTHKIIEVGEHTVTTQGVANNAPDAPITEGDYIARQQFVIPKLGVLLNFIRSRYGFLLLILLPLGGLILAESVQLTRKLKEYRKADTDADKAEEIRVMKEEIERLKRLDGGSDEHGKEER